MSDCPGGRGAEYDPDLRIPDEITAAARRVARYFAEQNIRGWKLDGCADRWTFAPEPTKANVVISDGDEVINVSSAGDDDVRPIAVARIAEPK